MIAALDVHYDETRRDATAAAVVFRCWSDAEPTAEYAARCADIQPYAPGQFFQRELPCLLAVLERVQEPLDMIVVDGYVWLGDQPGLGMHLWEALHKKRPVIGVAKTRFRGAAPLEVVRGKSKTPLFITAVGIDPAEAGKNILAMQGPFRMPALLKRADQLARA